jgi:hypothetical protein
MRRATIITNSSLVGIAANAGLVPIETRTVTRGSYRDLNLTRHLSPKSFGLSYG